MKTVYSILILILCYLPLSFAQLITFPSDIKLSTRNILPIIFDNEVKGYYAIYYYEQLIDEVDWNVVVMDVDFKIVREFKIRTDKNVGFRSSAFNGDSFCFLFGNEFSDVIQRFVFTRDGKYINKEEIKYVKKTKNSSGGLYNIASVPYNGFIWKGLDSEGEHNIEMIGSDGIVLWKIEPNIIYINGKKRSKEILSFHYADSSYLLLRVELPKVKTDDLNEISNYVLRAYNIKTGDELYTLDRRHDKGFLVPLGIQTGPNGVTQFGQYFGYSSSHIYYDGQNNLGFYFLMTDNNGKIVKESFNSWKDDMSKFLEFNEREQIEGNRNIWIHDVIVSATGKFYAICELYYRGKSLYVHVGDMMLIELDSELNILEISKYEKYNSGIDNQNFTKKVWVEYLPRMDYFEIGEFLRGGGYMDYEFCSQSPDRNKFSIVYKYYDQQDKGSKNYIIGSIALNRDGEIVNPKIVLNSKPDDIAVIPSKTGYVAVVEYFIKDNISTLTLYKLDM